MLATALIASYSFIAADAKIIEVRTNPITDASITDSEKDDSYECTIENCAAKTHQPTINYNYFGAVMFIVGGVGFQQYNLTVAAGVQALQSWRTPKD